MLKNVLFGFKSKGFVGMLSAVKRRAFPKEAICFQVCQKLVSGKIGLEIGGPSSIFKRKGILPVYLIAKQLDNCNFAGLTTWEGEIKEGLNFTFNENSPPGQQYLSEAANLAKIDSGKYDFVLSSHMLEHTANPLQALSEWTRVLKDEGILILVLPHKDGTFDNKRPVTTLSHLIQDFECGMQEDDLTHLPEILELHDFSKDMGSETLPEFKKRSENNLENRCIHHHVFDTQLAVNLLDYHGVQIHAVELIDPCHIVLIAQKVSSGKLDNQAFLKNDAEYKSISPFSSDKHLVSK
jgi:SAM-dependent methyltransferase